jgi:Uma2 family endonuclease
MPALLTKEKIWTAEEYLNFERESNDRHEFLDGYIFKMAGESIAHSRICVNLTTEISLNLRGKSCEALSPNMKVRTSTASLFSYPDLTIVCGEPQFHDTKKDVLINPRVIFEVLSPSTEKYDRGVKFSRYRMGNETLTDYVLVAQETSLVEHYQRQSDGRWVYLSYNYLDDIFKLDELDFEIPLEIIYDRVGIQPQTREENE